MTDTAIVNQRNASAKSRRCAAASFALKMICPTVIISCSTPYVHSEYQWPRYSPVTLNALCWTMTCVSLGLIVIAKEMMITNASKTLTTTRPSNQRSFIICCNVLVMRFFILFWSRWPDSNRWPTLYESAALPTELQRHVSPRIIADGRGFRKDDDR